MYEVNLYGDEDGIWLDGAEFPTLAEAKAWVERWCGAKAWEHTEVDTYCCWEFANDVYTQAIITPPGPIVNGVYTTQSDGYARR